MTHERFNEIVEEETNRIKEVLVKKQGEYNLDADRLSHFKEAANVVGWTPEKVLLAYRLKHEKSIIDMVNSGDKFSKELWTEKITDNINYLILLLGLLEDRDMFDKKPTKKAVGVKLNEGANK